MKPFLYLLLLLTCCVHAHAQPIYRLKKLLINEYKYQSYNHTNWEFRFSYSDNRKGILSDPDWIEDVLIYSNFTDSVQVPLPGMLYDSVMVLADGVQPLQYSKQYFDAGNNYMARVKMQWNNYKKRWAVSDSAVYTYSNGRLRKITDTHGPDSVAYHYNATGRCDTLWRFANGNLQDIKWWQYNTAGTLTLSGTLYDYQIYNYDMAGRLTETYTMRKPLDTARANYYIYDAAGRLAEHVQLISYTGGRLRNNNKEYFTYDGNNKRISTHRMYRNSHDPSIWENMSLINYTYNDFGLIDTAREKSWSDDQQQWIDYEGTSPGSGTYMLIFEYEIAWPVGIPAIQQDGIPTLTLFPNPASETLTISAQFQKAQPFTVSITDMQGRIVKQWKENAIKEYRQTIPVGNLPDGNYVLQLSGLQNATSQFVINRKK